MIKISATFFLNGKLSREEYIKILQKTILNHTGDGKRCRKLVVPSEEAKDVQH